MVMRLRLKSFIKCGYGFRFPCNPNNLDNVFTANGYSRRNGTLGNFINGINMPPLLHGCRGHNGYDLSGTNLGRLQLN